MIEPKDTNKDQNDWEDELFNIRAIEQKSAKDYSFEDDGSIEQCTDCRTPINSHGHCPRCDY